MMGCGRDSHEWGRFNLPLSSLFVALDVTPDNLGCIGTLLLGLFDEGGAVDPLAVELDILLSIGRVA